MEHEERADALDAEVDDLQHSSDKLEGEIGDTRSDWDSKKSDQKVPGAADESAAAPGGVEARSVEPEGEDEDGSGADEDEDGSGADEDEGGS